MSATFDEQDKQDRIGANSDQNNGSGRTRKGKAWNRTMKFVRRVHLYSGLFMFPWVMLYGVTALFFNHPQEFNGGSVANFSSQEYADTSLANLPTPDGTAEQVVAALNSSGEDESPRVQLTSARSAQYTSNMTFTVHADSVEHTVVINPVTGDGFVRSNPVEAEPEAPPNPLGSLRRVEIDQTALNTAQDAIPELLGKLNLASGEVSTGRRSASLSFSAEVDGEPCIMTYNLGNGFVSAVPEDERSTMETKQFLQRLHLSRGYPPHWNVRWLWGFLVDAMFVSMVFWGVSGVFMWWQIKRTRVLGTGVVLASAVCAVLLVVGMHDSLTSAPRRGGNHGGGGQGGPAANAGRPSDASPGAGRGRGRNGMGRESQPPITSEVNAEDLDGLLNDFFDDAEDDSDSEP